MQIDELGRRLRARRAATGRTIASVSAEAGLSVPYIANLENGRGNPTLSAIANLAAALGARLAVEMVDDAAARPEPEGLPDSLLQFARGARFSAEASRLAELTGSTPVRVREGLLTAMAAMAGLTARPLAELDWHRILDTAVLIIRG